MWAAPGLRVLGWGMACVCLGAGRGAGGGYEGRGVAAFPPFLAGGDGVCPGVGWDVASPFLIGFAGGACGSGIRLYPASLALAVWRVVLSRFFLTPARGVQFPRLGCVVALCGAGGPSPVPGACPVRCGGPSSTWVVVRPCLSLGAVPSAVRGCVGVAVGGGFPPLVLFFSAFPVGNMLSVVGEGVWLGGLVIPGCSVLPPHGSIPGSCSHGARPRRLLKSSSPQLLQSSSPRAGTQFAGTETKPLTFAALGHYLDCNGQCAFESLVYQLNFTYLVAEICEQQPFGNQTRREF